MYLALKLSVNDYYYTEGYYYLANGIVNGFPYWKQDKGEIAIWFQKSWTVGNEDNLGQDYNGIIGPNEVTAWPSQIISGYNYWQPYYSEWKNVEEFGILFEDCKCNVHVF